MSIRRAGLLLGLVIVAIAGSARPALACTCRSSGPVCQAFWTSPMVFDAVVRGIDTSSGLATLDVRKVWKGTVPATIQVSGSGGLSCDFTFRSGRRYLVVANGWSNDLLQVSACSPTHEWDGSGGDAEFLASLSRPATGGRIFGSVTYSTYLGGGIPEVSDVPVVTSVRLTTPSGRRTVMSTNGEFEFIGLASGAYRLAIDVPTGYAPAPSRSVRIPNKRACADESFSLIDNGRIAGRIVRGAQDPLPQKIDLIVARGFPDFAELRPPMTLINADGSFEVGELPPGDYVIGVNLKTRPTPRPESDRWRSDIWLAYASGSGTPRVFTIKAGERIDLGTWKLPAPARTVTASGFVAWEDGTPAVGVVLRLIENTTRTESLFLPAEVTTEADGHFSLPLLAGRSYRFTARYKWKDAPVVLAPALAIGTRPPPPVRIVIRAAK